VDFLRLETHRLKTTNKKLAGCEDCRQQEYVAKGNVRTAGKLTFFEANSAGTPPVNIFTATVRIAAKDKGQAAA